MNLATRLRDLRTEAGLTKTALAKPRYTVSYVSQIEAGRRTPSAEALSFFANQLGVTPRYLSTGMPDGLEDEVKFRIEEAREALRNGKATDAEEITRSALEDSSRYDLPALKRQALLVGAEAIAQQGNLQGAVDLYEQLMENDLPQHEAGLAVVGLARAYRVMGDLSYAAQVVETFLSRTSETPLDPSIATELQSVLVSIYFERGDVNKAERAARRALAAASQIQSLEIKAKTYWYAARVFAEAKRWDEALELSTRARVLMEEMEDRQSVARLHNAYAFICLETDPPKLDEAREHLERAEVLLEETGATGDLAYVYEERGRLALLEDHPEEALDYADRGLADSQPDALERARCLYLKGRALAALRRSEEARTALRQAAEEFRDQGARQQEASCWRELGELDLEAGDTASAVDALRAGLAALEPNRTRA
jgi:tetratricopeptide (TPR) repeat protein